MTTLKSIALELLQKYEESETSIICECSCDIDKSTKNLDAEVTKYRELIDKYAEQEPRWIPVSEKLPENGTYLVTLERFCGGEPRINMRSFAKDLNKVDEFDFPKHKCGWYNYDSEYGYWEDTGVIAWMPLPEPYEPQKSEDVCEKCLYAEETDGSHCYECVKGESKYKAKN